MLGSVSSLTSKVQDPLETACGSGCRVISIEMHGQNIHGLAFIPGKVIRYVYESKTQELRFKSVLSLIQHRRVIHQSPHTDDFLLHKKVPS